jgi:hypothetical protein
MASESATLSEKLTRLDHWNGGRNHIIFEFSDAPCIPFQPEHAMVASVGLSTFHYRKGLDIAMPLFAMVEFNSSVRKIPASARKLLLSFRGTRSPRSDQTRRHLWKLHNGVDVITPCACRWFDAESATPTGYDERCKLDEVDFEGITYTGLLASSKFSLIVEGFGCVLVCAFLCVCRGPRGWDGRAHVCDIVPRGVSVLIIHIVDTMAGCRYHSFRLTEVLAAGAIPVIVIDHYVLPYEDVLDWSEFSVRVPEHLLLDVPAILRAIPAKTVAAMQRRAARVYEQVCLRTRLPILFFALCVDDRGAHTCLLHPPLL